MSIHDGHRKRLKEEATSQGSVDFWPAHKHVEYLLTFTIPRGDVNPVAHALVEHFGSLSGVLDATKEELLQVKGVGEHTAALLCYMPKLFRSYTASRSRTDIIINSPIDAYEVLKPWFFGAQNETVYILCLDLKNQSLGVRKISEGSIFASEINMRRIAEETFRLRGAKIYLAHNHVSSLALPSEMDWQMTQTLYGGLGPVGIELVDHLVFQDEEMVSLRSSSEGKVYLPV